jgi:hypothetical protein
MFTKKHLGPVNCASCEKNIINLEGRMAEYIPWKRLPFKEPNERISKARLFVVKYIVWAWFFTNFVYAETGALSRRIVELDGYRYSLQEKFGKCEY